MTKHVQMLPEHRHAVPRKRTDEADAAFDQAQPLDPRAILQTAALAPQSLRPADILRLQQTLGNRAVELLLNGLVSSPPVIQAKLTVNAPGDEYEREADRMAEQVMRMPAVPRAVLDEEEHENAKPEVMTKPQPSPAAGGAFAVRKAFERPLPSALREEFETKPEVMTKPQPSPAAGGALRKAFERPLPSALREEFETKPEVMTGPQPSPEAGGAFVVRKAFERQLNAAREQGQPLPPALREDFETKFGADFSRVRVHADALADQLNQSIQAKAFTTGQDVFFRRGAYEPGSTSGQRLIAHELTHVAQQGRATSAGRYAGGAAGVVQRAKITYNNNQTSVQNLADLEASLKKLPASKDKYENAWLELIEIAGPMAANRDDWWSTAAAWCEVETNELKSSSKYSAGMLKKIISSWGEEEKKRRGPKAENVDSVEVEVEAEEEAEAEAEAEAEVEVEVEVEVEESTPSSSLSSFSLSSSLSSSSLSSSSSSSSEQQTEKWAQVTKAAAAHEGEAKKAEEVSSPYVTLGVEASQVLPIDSKDPPKTLPEEMHKPAGVLLKWIFCEAFIRLTDKAKTDEIIVALLNYLKGLSEQEKRKVTLQIYGGWLTRGESKAGLIIIDITDRLLGKLTETDCEQIIELTARTFIHEAAHDWQRRKYQNISYPWEKESGRRYGESQLPKDWPGEMKRAWVEFENAKKLGEWPLSKKLEEKPPSAKEVEQLGDVFTALTTEEYYDTKSRKDLRGREFVSHLTELVYLWGQDRFEDLLPYCSSMLNTVIKGQKLKEQ
jgi:hypothetical protein